MFLGPLGALFLIGMFLPRATGRTATPAVLLALAVSVVWSYWKRTHSCLRHVVFEPCFDHVGDRRALHVWLRAGRGAVAPCRRRRRSSRPAFTWWEVMKRPVPEPDYQTPDTHLRPHTHLPDHAQSHCSPTTTAFSPPSSRRSCPTGSSTSKSAERLIDASLSTRASAGCMSPAARARGFISTFEIRKRIVEIACRLSKGRGNVIVHVGAIQAAQGAGAGRARRQGRRGRRQQHPAVCRRLLVGRSQGVLRRPGQAEPAAGRGLLHSRPHRPAAIDRQSGVAAETAEHRRASSSPTRTSTRCSGC